MHEAVSEAARAAERGEVPIGAVVVIGGEIVGRGHNHPIQAHDATAHAEIEAMRDAGRRLGNYRLTGATLYVTVEPCLMCVGAMVHARVETLVFGTPEPKAGAIESTQHAHEHPALNHRLTVVSGVLAKECADLIRGFFQQRRPGSSGRL
jgi:tRNA(adenine34) deaminase